MTDVAEKAPLVMAADRWPTNGHLIATMPQLGYLHADWHTLDPTWGRGKWWTIWRPRKLTPHDIRVDGIDFRALPYPDGHFDAAVYDPPYIAPGGRKTSTTGEFNDRYGITDVPRRPEDLHQELISPGLKEVARVVRPGGLILAKCKDYINGRRYRPATHWLRVDALDLYDLTIVDEFVHITGTGPQSQTTQDHARRNFSNLFVFRTPDRPVGARLFEPGATVL